jgi:hypothetical protein
MSYGISQKWATKNIHSNPRRKIMPNAKRKIYSCVETNAYENQS